MNKNQLYGIVVSAALATFLIAFATDTEARMQRGYIKKNGIYVSPHLKSKPDGRRYNNNGSRTNGGKQRYEFSGPLLSNSKAAHQFEPACEVLCHSPARRQLQP